MVGVGISEVLARMKKLPITIESQRHFVVGGSDVKTWRALVDLDASVSVHVGDTTIDGPKVASENLRRLLYDDTHRALERLRAAAHQRLHPVADEYLLSLIEASIESIPKDVELQFSKEGVKWNG